VQLLDLSGRGADEAAAELHAALRERAP
jgi:hypothetical protein